MTGNGYGQGSALGICGLALMMSVAVPAARAQDPPPRAFGGSFTRLAPEQQQLVRDWAVHFTELTGKKLDAEQTYNAARVSERTTFDAVTHALLHTNLTDAAGRPMGRAIDLVEALELVAGEEPGARGDRQFRLYVRVNSAAFRTLAESREFFRERDNTVYHHGYPYSFRMAGTPSVQVSMSRDGARADIDVDYRSSSFPQFVFNGHLSSSNSDVRAGDNLERHDGRWAGFAGWWHNLFGFLPPAPSDDRAPGVALDPPVDSKEPLATAVEDMLSSLFLKHQPGLAAAYFGPASNACIDRAAAVRGVDLAPGMTRPYLVRQLAAVADAAGRPERLEDVVEAVEPWNGRLKPLKNARPGLFLLLEVPNDLAAAIDCDPRAIEDVPPGEVGKFGRYYGSAFRLKRDAKTEATAYLLWEKQGKFWKIVAYNVADTGGQLRLPINAAPPPPAPPLARVKGNRDALKAMRDFARQWFEKQDYERALAYVSPRSDVCLSASGDPTRQHLSHDQARALLLDGFRVISRAVGKRGLSKAIEPVVPSHELLRLVSHGDETAFAVVEVPDVIGEWFMCRPPGDAYTPPSVDLDPANHNYEHYYGMEFRLRVPFGEAATLQTLWAMEDGGWKIIAWRTEAP